MLYYGEFGNERGARIRVEIEAYPTINTEYSRVEIGGDHVRFSADSPIMITGEIDDLFSPIVTQSGTISLLTRAYQPDLYRADIRDATVRIWETPAGSTAERLVFRGFVLPQSYTQPFAEAWDTLDVNIVDCLASLDQLRWSDVMTRSTAPVTLDDCTRGALARLFPDMKVTMDTRYYVNGSGSDILKSTINPSVFLGEDEEDESTFLEALEHCLRYMNLHAAQEGDTIRLYPYEEVWQTEPIDLGAGFAHDGLTEKRVYHGTDHQIEIGETYNEISLEVDVEERDELMPSPLDSDTLTSPYDRRQLYCTEYCARGSGWSSAAMSPMLAGFSYPDANDTGKMWKREYYVRVKESPGWRFFQSGDWKGDLQGSGLTLFYGDLYSLSRGHNQQDVPDMVTERRAAALIEVGSAKTTYSRDEYNPPAKISADDYLIVGVAGRDAGQESWHNTAHRLQLRVPRAIYNGGNTVRLSPEDSDTTRYIVISGKIAMAPPVKTPNIWAKWQSYIDPILATGTDLLPDCGSYLNTIKTEDGDARHMIRRYWKADLPSDTPEENDGTTASPGRTGTRGDSGEYYGLDMWCSDDTSKFHKYIGSMRLLSVWTGKDRIVNVDVQGKIGVLSCMLIVGDKCVVESSGDGGTGCFSWQTFKPLSECSDKAEFFRQSFCIGIDPKVGDYLIGPEYDIANNIRHTMNLDCEGMAIPVTKEDQVSGEVTFIILGPCDLAFEANAWFEDRYCFLGGIESEDSEERFHLLENVSAIWVKGLTVELKSDNAGADPLGDYSLVYTSDTEKTYRNRRDDLTLAFGSALTAEERAELGARDAVWDGTVLDDTGEGLTSVEDAYTGFTGKPEQLYVDWYWRQMNQPAVEVIQTMISDAATMFRSYTHPALPGKRFYPLSMERDLGAGSAKVRMREIKE